MFDAGALRASKTTTSISAGAAFLRGGGPPTRLWSTPSTQTRILRQADLTTGFALPQRLVGENRRDISEVHPPLAGQHRQSQYAVRIGAENLLAQTRGLLPEDEVVAGSKVREPVRP